jgi:hypothetical protein
MCTCVTWHETMKWRLLSEKKNGFDITSHRKHKSKTRWKLKCELSNAAIPTASVEHPGRADGVWTILGRRVLSRNCIHGAVSRSSRRLIGLDLIDICKLIFPSKNCYFQIIATSRWFISSRSIDWYLHFFQNSWWKTVPHLLLNVFAARWHFIRYRFGQ